MFGQIRQEIFKLFSVVIPALVGNLSEEQGFLADIKGNERKIPDEPE